MVLVLGTAVFVKRGVFYGSSQPQLTQPVSLQPSQAVSLQPSQAIKQVVDNSLPGLGVSARLQVRAQVSRDTAANPVQRENIQFGTRDWHPNFNKGADKFADDKLQQIKGYAGATSVNIGQSIGFHVSVNPAQTYSMKIYRVGWYGGKGGRLVKSLEGLKGTPQPTCPLDPRTGLIECRWAKSYTLNVPKDWASGFYVVVLQNQQGYKNWMQFTLRDDARKADFVYQVNSTTFQAYNRYPNDGQRGKSTYVGWGPQVTSADEPYYSDESKRRALKVSFDRPYQDHGELHGFWRGGEVVINWLEKEGYDVVYTDDIHTHQNPGYFQQYKAVLFGGHDEYWSKELFDAAEQARDKGVHQVYFYGNNAYWQVRFESGISGKAARTMVVYKNADLDPEPNPSRKTVLFRDVGRPEQTLIGVQYTTVDGSSEPEIAYNPMIVKNTHNWVFAGTIFQDGDPLTGGAGMEVDKLFSNYPGPKARYYKILGDSPFNKDRVNASIYQAPSGAWIFATGALSWPLALIADCCYSPDAEIMIRNLLERFKDDKPMPFKGQARGLPGKIEAEHFDEGGDGLGYADNTQVNSGGQYRETAVDLFNASDPQDAKAVVVGNMDTGEWLNYTVKVGKAGQYIPTLRIKPGGRVGVRLEVDGKTVAQTTVAGSSWANVRLPRIPLSEGNHQLRIAVDSGSMAFNWIKVE
jgi:hypothetical protein